MIFVGIFAYGFGRKLREGGTNAERLDAALRAEQDDAGEASTVPAFRTLARLRRLDETMVWTDCYSTLIAKARSTACGIFLDANDQNPDCNQLVLLDEDIDAPLEALEALRDAANQASGRKRVATACVRIGDGQKLSVHPKRLVVSAQQPTTSVDELEALAKRSPFEVDSTGFACAWIPVECLRRVVASMGSACMYRTGVTREELAPRNGATAPALRHVRAPALFLESVQNGEWINEDYAFSTRVRNSRVELVSIVHGGVVHAGVRTL